MQGDGPELILRRLESEVQSLSLSHSDRDFRALFTEFLVPGNDSVLTWRQSGNLVRPIAPANGKERVREHRDVGPFPRMLIALYWYEDFRRGKFLFQR